MSKSTFTIFDAASGEEESRIVFVLEAIKAQIKIIRSRTCTNDMGYYAKVIQIDALEKTYDIVLQNKCFCEIWMNGRGKWFISIAESEKFLCEIRSTRELVEQIKVQNPKNLFLQRLIVERCIKK